jgi:hypothetical protein
VTGYPGSSPLGRNVSSLAEVIAESTGRLTLVPAAGLQGWLPDLVVPLGWTAGAVDDAPATRVLTRRQAGGRTWEGCEILSVYRVPGTVPESVVVNDATRTLRDSGAHDIRTQRLATVPRHRLVAMRSTGTLHANARAVESHFNHYVFNTDAGAALVEQVIAVSADAYEALASELVDLTETLYRSLMARIDRALASSIRG